MGLIVAIILVIAAFFFLGVKSFLEDCEDCDQELLPGSCDEAGGTCKGFCGEGETNISSVQCLFSDKVCCVSVEL